MRRSEDETIDPEVAAQLDAIDATLAGDAVDPRHAELAELALLLAAGRPEPDGGFARELDGRVAGRFGASARPGSRRVRSWTSLPVLGSALAAGAAAIVAVVAIGGSGGSAGGIGSGGPRLIDQAKRVPATVTSGATVTSAASSAAARGSVGHSSPGAVFAPAGVSSGAGVPSAAGVPGAALAPAPTPNGRKIVQSAQLALSTGASHVDDVAQEVFNVVGSEHGIVNSSNVTATGGLDGYAHFDLSLPSGNLSDAMGRLSRLRYASVSSRTDSTQDVNGSFVAAGRRLADAQALRTALLKQLAAATTTTQISSLHAQIRDAENAIANAQADLRGLNHRVNFSSVSVTVAATLLAPVSHGGSGGFTLRRALHDAGRVLTVAAGVALITLAVLVPVGLVGLLGWWISSAARRRRREHALDLA
ncbi:MAG TPA: DUF4349 domain-containing protein [Solirubrobacteraceae bacterium]